MTVAEARACLLPDLPTAVPNVRMLRWDAMGPIDEILNAVPDME